MTATIEETLKTELKSFQSIWHGGYYEGNPLDPLANSAYGQLGFISTLHATYLRCIKPYVKSETVALEIGPGRGGWTRCLLPAKKVYALDALSAQHNAIFEFLNYPTNLEYFQVRDFECEMLPTGEIDYMFSFGCLCHVSFDGISRYAERLFEKLKPGANCFWLVGDAQKYNRSYQQFDIWNALERMVPAQGRGMVAQLRLMSSTIHQVPAGEVYETAPGQWHIAGIQRTCAMLKQFGYAIEDPDVGTNLRDPIIHFRKPD